MANSCYKPVAESWDGAASRCKSIHRSAHLVFVNNAAEMKAVADLIRQTSANSSVETFCKGTRTVSFPLTTNVLNCCMKKKRTRDCRLATDKRKGFTNYTRNTEYIQ